MFGNLEVDYLVALDFLHCQLYFAQLDLFSSYLLGCDITDVVQEPETLVLVCCTAWCHV